MTKQLEQKSIIQPDLPDVLLNLKLDILASLNCHMPGTIISFDAAKCTASVQPAFKSKLPNGNVVSRPVLVDCPVLFPGGGGGRLTFPVAAGDICLIFYQDRRIDEWVQSGGQVLPATQRMHDLSDAVIMVGLDPTASFGSIPMNKVVLSYQGSSFELTSTGWNFVGTGGAEIDLTTLVSIKNNATTLKAVLDTLITAIEGIQVTGPLPLTPDSVTALEAARTLMGTLLI